MMIARNRTTASSTVDNNETTVMLSSSISSFGFYKETKKQDCQTTTKQCNCYDEHYHQQQQQQRLTRTMTGSTRNGVSHNNNNVSMLILMMTMILVCMFIPQQQQQVLQFGVYAYPTGAGSCVGGIPAVSGSDHVNPLTHITIRGGSLVDGGIVVQLIPVSSPTSIIELTPESSSLLTLATEVEYTIAVIGTIYQYKGCLIRLERLNTDSSTTTDDMSLALVPAVGTRSASDVCTSEGTNVVGITHNNSDFKQQHTGTIYIDTPSKVQLDVTIVGISNETISLYAYNNYTLTFRHDAPLISTPTTPIATTAAPVAVPAPVATAPAPTAPVSVPTTSNNNSIIDSIPPTFAPTIVNLTFPTVPIDNDTAPVTAPTPLVSTPTTGTGTGDGKDNDQQYTEVISETISNIQVSFENVQMLQLSELRIVETIFDEWFLYFYNNRSSQTVSTTTTTTNNTTTNTTTSQRLLQGTTEVPPPQAFVVQGSMETVINVLKQNVTTDISTGLSINTITYNQQLLYRIYTADNPGLPNEMKNEYYVPLEPVEYSILPYRSTSGNADLVKALQTSNDTTAFVSMQSPIAVPVVDYSDGDSSNGGSTSDDDSTNTALIAGIAIAGVGVLVLMALLFVLLQMNNKRNKVLSMNHHIHDSSTIHTTNNLPMVTNSIVVQQQPPTNNNLSATIRTNNAATNNNTGKNRSITPNNNKLVGKQKGEEEDGSFGADSQYTNGGGGATKTTINGGIGIGESSAAVVGVGGVLSDDQDSTTVTPAPPSTPANPGEQYVVYAPKGKLGIVVDNPDDDSGPIIYAIKETSPLLDSLLNVGDRLIMVDEVDVTKMVPSMISKLISRRSSNPMRKLTLIRAPDSPAERLAV